MKNLSPSERLLNRQLLTHPAVYQNRFTHAADCNLREILFRSLTHNRDDYLSLLFPDGPPVDQSQPWSLREAQGAIEGAEYTAAAKGTACGHIFKSGESTYHCKTCASDDTCVLCAKCFESSDHEDHMVFVSVSPGNSGCCDCGDHEAWRKEVRCTIHSEDAAPRDTGKQSAKEKAKEWEPHRSDLPVDLVESIRMTISRSVDYLCDVFSCSPEQLRMPKSEESILQDEELSRLSGHYGEGEQTGEDMEYALVLWNDEKHTVYDVETQVARACQKNKRFGNAKAMEVNDIGRSIVEYSKDVPELLRRAAIIEQLKVTVTVRSARDTFREQMCATIIDWISDISGCAVGSDPYILRNFICEELLRPWRTGSQASNKDLGQNGIDDHEIEENDRERSRFRNLFRPIQAGGNVVRLDVEIDDEEEDEDDDETIGNDNDDDDNDFDEMDVEEDGMDFEIDDLQNAGEAALGDINMDADFLEENEDVTEALEATLAGYPPPPPPPAAGQRRRATSPPESDDGGAGAARPLNNAPYRNIPPTPKSRGAASRSANPGKHWLEKPEGFGGPRSKEPCEDLWQRVRLDFLILYDLRLWKTLRVHLRHLYITTVVTIPHFKRVIGLRFAGLYTALAQLYLIADREPDHSIINLSVQMLTTPTITEEVVDRGNFLTNLMSILYTFLTTRQVGFPEDVSPKATLAFDAGAVTNRRMFHFFLDLRWLFQSPFILYRMRIEQRYLLQFLDLVKLHQGVCPNVRATGDHVEYESDTWISASMIVKEINKICKQVSAAFEPRADVNDDSDNIKRAITTVGQVTMANALGFERRRFHAAETKRNVEFGYVGPFAEDGPSWYVPSYEVHYQPMSFHHPLHYLLSWLIENATLMERDEVRSFLLIKPHDLDLPKGSRATFTYQELSLIRMGDLLPVIFDHPLRVCAWLAQMKAGMWVRNGITLRHQAHTYRSVSHRDVGYQRDIFMVQAGLVLCGADHDQPGQQYLAMMINHFQMQLWFKGDYSVAPGFEEHQQVDVLEDFYHLLVIALSERANLIPVVDKADQHDKVLQHDIAHTLCFKPLAFSDIATRVTEKVSESDEFNRVLEGMTTFRAPEGLNDHGAFELKPEYIETVDPYYAHFSRNSREEAEVIYRNHMASKIGKKAEDVVYEPHLEPISSGLFKNLSAFTATPLFSQVLLAGLNYAASVRTLQTKMQATRIETFLHMVLHLALLATMEAEQNGNSFIELAASPITPVATKTPQSVVSALVTLSGMEEYASCHPTIKHILRKMQSQQPEVSNIVDSLGAMLDRKENDSPASLSNEDKERKKQEAKARQAKVMAQMKQQQNSFLQNQGMSAFGEDLDDSEDLDITEEPETTEQKKKWSFPAGTCIWCQEEADEQRVFGSFAYLSESNIVRTTPVEDEDFVKEVIDTPANLDRSAEDIRPFGVAGDNKQMVEKVGADGETIRFERQGLSKGFPQYTNSIKGPVATSCGHIMHFSCFELYLANSFRRHTQHIARNHPESIELQEFTCPLCKALGNTFMPIIWKEKECAHDHEMHAATDLGEWMVDAGERYAADFSFLHVPTAMQRQQRVKDLYSERATHHVNDMFSTSLAANLQELATGLSPTASTSQQRYSLRRGYSLGRLFNIGGQGDGSPGGSDAPDSTSPSDQPRRMTELMKAYKRIDDTIRVNNLCAPEQIEDGTLNPVNPLSRALGLSISAFEIAHRGVGQDELSTSLLSDLPEHTLTHFRVLSETIESYLAVNVIRPSAVNPVGRETAVKRDLMTLQLFGPADRAKTDILSDANYCGLLDDDVFLFFVDWLHFVGPSVTDAHGALQLCYWAEIVKVVIGYAMILVPGGEAEGTVAADSSLLQANIPSEPATDDFIKGVEQMLSSNEDPPDAHPPSDFPRYALLRHLIDKYALAFLRKALVAMHVHFGLDFSPSPTLSPSNPELARLTTLLHLPSIQDLFALYANDPSHQTSTPPTPLVATTTLWIRDSLNLRLPHPTIPELIGLPKNYDTLTSEALKRTCPTTGKDLSDPALCLLCGAIFCSQAICCMPARPLTNTSARGGCARHMDVCGSSVGLFLLIRKGMVVMLHGQGRGRGTFVTAPYLDRFGEADPTLRRHRQLFLSGRRYDGVVRGVWLGLGVASVISRRLEADVNPGGWETL